MFLSWDTGNVLNEKTDTFKYMFIHNIIYW